MLKTEPSLTRPFTLTTVTFIANPLAGFKPATSICTDALPEPVGIEPAVFPVYLSKISRSTIFL